MARGYIFGRSGVRLASVVTAVVAAVLSWAPRVGGAEDAWLVCESRSERDAEVEPGGLRLLGVKESPLGDFPRVVAAATQEHFFQQLREVWADDCPRVFVQLGLQPAAGAWRNWTAASLWLRYFNHSGAVVVVDPVEDYLRHTEEGLQAYAKEAGARVRVTAVRAAVASEGRGGASMKERPVAFDAPGGRKVLAADEVIRWCSADLEATAAAASEHPCARVLRRMADHEPLEYTAQVRTFDEIWRNEVGSRHVDFLRVEAGLAGMAGVFEKGFADIIAKREVSVISFRLDELWTKEDLKAVVEWLDKFEYFALFQLLCSDSSQVGSFEYLGPGRVGPTTYLPLSGIDFGRVIQWDQLVLPQDILALDLRQPDIFKALQIGDEQCDADEACPADGSGGPSCAAPAGPPEAPRELRVIRTESRMLALEWRPAPDGPRPESYSIRVDPNAWESMLDHDPFAGTAGAQLHRVTGLQPNTEYVFRLKAMGRGGASPVATLRYRTEREEPAAAAAAYDVAEGMHCGLSTSEEVLPTGPPPQGRSFYQDTTGLDSCRTRCDDMVDCVAYQVKIGDACWLYRQRPSAARLSGERRDSGWACGVRRG